MSRPVPTNPLLRAALWTCPRAFRTQYREQIAAHGVADPLTAAVDVFAAGVMLRLEAVGRDLLLAARSLARSPVYAVVAVAAIALAIAANVSVASVLEGVLLDPLPFPHAGELYQVAEHTDDPTMSYPDGRDIAARNVTLAAFGFSAHVSSTLRGEGRALRVDGRTVDEGYFGVLQATPQLGRFLGRADLGTRRVVISDALWRERFGASASVIGRRIDLDGTRYTVVGVAPASMRDLGNAGLVASQYWVAFDPRAGEASRNYAASYAWARLRPGATPLAAQRDIARIVSDLDRRFRPADRSTAPGPLVPALTFVAGAVQPLLWLTYAAVAVLLLIACANLANLSLVRAAVRERELIVRSALGASRSRIAAQLGAESFVIALCGGIAGVALGWAGLHAFALFGAQMLPRWESVRIDGMVLAYTGVLVVLVTLVTGALPAVWLRRDIASGLKSAGRSGDRSASKRLRSLLVVLELGLAIAVVASAGVIVRSFVALTAVPVGFDARNAVELDRVVVPAAAMRAGGELERIFRELRAIPGVVDVAASFEVPFGGAARALSVGTRVPPASPAVVAVHVNAVAGPYFRTLGIPVLRGRAFTEADRATSAPVALVSAAFARRYFGTLDVVGRSILPGISASAGKAPPQRIVGVVGDVRYRYSAPYEPEIYEPMAQIPLIGDIVVRTDGRDAGFAKAATDALARVDPALAAPLVRPYPLLFALDAVRSQAAAVLFGAFALLALFLALSGIYAVTSYSVEQRTREFGVRRAVGARAASILALVLRDAAGECAAGIAIGVAIAAAFSRTLSAVLFQTSPLDPVIVGAVIATLAACALLAALVPAVRGIRVGPAEALRYE